METKNRIRGTKFSKLETGEWFTYRRKVFLKTQNGYINLVTGTENQYRSLQNVFPISKHGYIETIERKVEINCFTFYLSSSVFYTKPGYWYYDKCICIQGQHNLYNVLTGELVTSDGNKIEIEWRRT